MEITSKISEQKELTYFDNKLSSKLIFLGIIGYITILFFNGIIMHFGVMFHILEVIRPYLPEIFILISIIGCFMNNKKVSYILLIFTSLFIVICIFSVSNYTMTSFLITIRNFFIPIFIMIIISTCKLENKSYDMFKKILMLIISLFILVGCVLSIVQQNKGWAWMSEFFQGYESWGDNGKVRVVWSTWNTLRTLGTTGDSATFGLYNSISIIILLFFYKDKKFLKFFLIVLSIIAQYNSGNKTALLLSFFSLFYYIMSKVFVNNEKIGKLVFKCSVILLFILSIIYIINAGEDSFFYTMNIRIDIWKTILTEENIYNLFLPHSVFDYSAFGNSGGATTIWDNSYLFLLFSFGFVGFLILLYITYSIIKPTWKNEFVKILTYVLLLSMFSTNIFIGRNISCFIFLFLGLCCALRRSNIYEY